MLESLLPHNPVLQALIATMFTWFVTALGAAMVFFFKTVRASLLNFMLGSAAGIMIAASFWSLLAPAIQMSGGNVLPSLIGFLLGGIFLRGIDLVLPHLHIGNDITESEGIKTPWGKSTLLFLAITMHNFPEGLAVGVGFGAATLGLPTATIAGAIALTLGIGIQNFPEGAAVSIPLRREGLSIGRSFFWGQFSGMMEPIAGVLGALLVVAVRPILPYAMAFAAGAMIYVVSEEVIPESQKGKYSHLSTIGVMLGFAVMMALDVALG
jgi:zinc transporter, ZIP family